MTLLRCLDSRSLSRTAHCDDYIPHRLGSPRACERFIFFAFSQIKCYGVQLLLDAGHFVRPRGPLNVGEGLSWRKARDINNAVPLDFKAR